MTLAEELQWRGFVNQTTFPDINDINEPRTFYWGVDPSADSMHIGQLAMAVMIRHFIAHGHKAVLLAGGATGMIGDPDGKADERSLKSVEEVEKNKAGIIAQYQQLFTDDSLEIVDNYDWFKDMNYLEFLRNVGKHFSMTQLLDRDFIQSRIGEGGTGISYAEFSYSLIQGYDFLHLFREKNVTLQIAGADQWGNSISGVHLLRKIEGQEAHVWTAPLIVNKTTGKKFGKSEDGAVWLDAKKTSPYKFYQFWLNVDDIGVGDYLKIYTDIQPAQYDALMAEFGANPGARAAQKQLAFQVTKLAHGEQRATQAQNVTEVLFGGRSFSDLAADELSMLAMEIPSVSSATAIEALVESGAAASNGEARRLISGGAVSVNGEKISDDTELNAPSLLKKGKNTFILVR